MNIFKLITISLIALLPIYSFAQKSDIVYATGSGYSEMSALKDAYRNAVSQKVATLIESSTIIRNEEIIEDKIIAASGGFISDMEIIVPAKRDSNGLYTVGIKARVLHDKIITTMQGAGSIKAVNIQAVKAKSQGKVSAQEEVGNFILKTLDVYMRTWNFEVVDTRTNKNDANSLIVEIRGTLSESDYVNKFYKHLEKKLISMGFKRSTYIHREKSPFIQLSTDLSRNSFSYFYMPILRSDAVESPFKDYVKSILDKESYILRVDLKGEDNEILATKNIFLKKAGTNFGFAFSLGYDSICLVDEHFIGAYLTADKKSIYCRQETKAFNLYIGEEIDEVKSVCLTVLRVDNSTSMDGKWE